MEQAVNQFNKGLQMDTHPMVQGNDTLSDALNATFVTMNGNEVVLQNDMGNRRIDNAFLPSGYQPLGMKEYGGVIYVAAYNPITNRGQVGSFPSPQRKVNIDNANGAKIVFNDFIAKETDNIYYINKEYVIIPISDKIVLHTGDKFSVYSQQIVNILPYLTLPEHTKNNLFTFQVGIFNSQNEFIDISDKLKLWDIGNYKYFINSEKPNELNETISDSELLRARNRLAINTYSQKMASPLYLKAIINHINNISYSIGGEIVESNKVNLEIKVNFQYNCVDYIQNKGTFEIYFNGIPYPASETLEEPTYSQESEQYTATYLYKINNPPVSSEEISGQKKYKYEIKFPLLHQFDEWSQYDPIYIKSLNKSGELDLSKLDSDTLIFKGYRYFNDTSKELTTLIVNLENYTKKVSNLHFCAVIKDPKQGNNIVYEIIDKHEPETGTLTIQFPYKDLEKRKLYLFEFYYYNDLEKTRKGSEEWKGFYITTPIFNGNYVGEKEQSLEEYKLANLVNIKNGDIYYSYDVMSNYYIDDFRKIKKVLLSPILNHSITSVFVENTVFPSGNYIKPLSTPDNSSYNNTYYNIREYNKVKNVISVSASVNNIEIYPSEIESMLKIENTNNNPIQTIERSIDEDIVEKIGNSYNYSKNLKEIKSAELVSNDSDVIEISEETSFQNIEQNLQKIELISHIKVNNRIEGYLEKKSIHCDHLITSFSNLIKKYYYGQNQMNYITLRPPYITIDWEGTEYVSIISSPNLQALGDATKVDERVLSKISGEIQTNKRNVGSGKCNIYIDEVARDSISDFILSNCDGQLIVGEYTDDDYVIGFFPCINDGTFTYTPGSYIKGGMAKAHKFKRFWLRISKKEYIPIYTMGKADNDQQSLMEDFYNDKGVFKLIFSNIPHHYEYETGGKTLQEKIINPNTMNKTIEFEVNSNINTIITENIELIGEDINYGLTQNGSYISSESSSTKVSKKISFNEGTISSNEEFIEEVENLSNYHVNSAIMFGDEDDPNHKLQVRDCEGNIIDPIYVYYNNAERNPSVLGNIFKKSYVADKFYIPDLDIYMPELKSSRKLYGGEFGEHGLINEYVYPVTNIRKDLVQNNSEFYVIIDLEEKETSDTTTKGLWDKTYIQYEGGGSDRSDSFKDYQLPLRTRNIFNRSIILDFSLTTPKSDGSSSMPTNYWVDYDTYIRNLNNNS